MILLKPKRVVDTKYLEYIRKIPCLISRNRAEAHHLITRKSYGSDYTAIPLAHALHVEIETMGIVKFEEKYQICLWREAHSLLEGYHERIKHLD